VVNNTPHQDPKIGNPSASRRTSKSIWQLLRQEQGLPVWLLLVAFGIMLLIWNWQLITATLLGILVMVMMYASQEYNWNHLLWRIHRFFQSPYRHFPISVASGTSTILLTYIIFSLWSTQENHWLATANIVQLVSICGIFVLLIRQSFKQWLQRQQLNFDQLISQLTVNDDLTRLLAIKQINQYVRENYLPAAQEQAIASYCQLLLSHENESTMRDALFETLEALQSISTMPTLQKAKHPHHPSH
jgi:hypothetical protein